MDQSRIGEHGIHRTVHEIVDELQGIIVVLRRRRPRTAAASLGDNAWWDFTDRNAREKMARRRTGSFSSGTGNETGAVESGSMPLLQFLAQQAHTLLGVDISGQPVHGNAPNPCGKRGKIEQVEEGVGAKISENQADDGNHQ
mgnify:CR=1 FL=1